MIWQILLALLTGTIVDGLFALLKLPVPAPQSFIGIAGIFGLWLGWQLIQLVK